VRRYDSVIFDAGETLLHPHPSFIDLLGHFIRERGHDVETARVIEAETALAQPIAQMFLDRRLWSVSVESSRAFWTSLYERFVAELGIEDAGLPNHLYEMFRKPEHYALFDDALPALRELRATGYRIGIVSNFEAWLEGLLTSLEVMPFLDALVVSGVEGVEKPDPKIFEIALERIGTPPERSVYVGDSPEFDVAPAASLGMRALLIDRRGRHDPAQLPVITSLVEIPEVIG
jgi:putative hydrolase of the HAD superfamily